MRLLAYSHPAHRPIDLQQPFPSGHGVCYACFRLSDTELPALPVFGPEERVCGNCKLWKPYSVDEARGWIGPCLLQPERAHFPPSAPVCDDFASRHGKSSAPRAETPRAPRSVRSVAPTVVRHRPPPSQVIDLGGELNMTREELMDIFREASGDT